MHLQVSNSTNYITIKAESIQEGTRLGIITKTLDLLGVDYALMAETTLEIPLNKRDGKKFKKN